MIDLEEMRKTDGPVVADLSTYNGWDLSLGIDKLAASWYLLLYFIKPILGNRYVRCQGLIMSEPRETHPRSEITDVPTSPCPPLDNLGCPDPHPSP